MFRMFGNSSVNGCNNTFLPHQKSTILLANGIAAMCSCASCMIALLLLAVLRLYKSFIYRLAMYQILGSLFHGFSMALVLMLLNYNSEVLYYQVICKLTAFLMAYSIWVILLFTVWLTFHLFIYVVFFKDLKRLEWLYISSSVLLPILFVWIPFIHDSYGVSGAWCFIRSWDDDCATRKYTKGIAEQFALYYGPATVAMVVSVTEIAVILVVVVKRASQSVI